MPRIKLTEKIIKSLDPDKEFEGKKGNEVYYSDTERQGLVLVLNRGGRKAYYYRYNGANGKQIKKSIGSVKSISLESARAIVKNYNEAILAGRDPFQEIKHETEKTFSAVYDKWREWSETHKQDRRSYYRKKSMRDSRGALSYFNDIPLDKITKSIVEDYQALKLEPDENGKKNKAATINRHFIDLKFLAKWAIDHGIIDSHQLGDVKKIPETDSVPKTDHFTPEEREKFLATVKEASSKRSGGRNMAYLWPLTLLLLNTGMRPGSALGLIWDDVDLRSGEIRLRAANIKTRKDAHIYISPDMVHVLTEWKRQTTGRPEDPLFPGNGSQLKSVKKQYKRLFEKAGLDKKYSTYSLRHDCASELLAVGANLTDVQMALVHTDPRTTLKYAHPSAERMKQVAALLDKKRKESE